MRIGGIEFDIQRVYFVHCPLCNENIVERSDEILIDTAEAARNYARVHYQNEHSSEADKRIDRQRKARQ